VGGVAIRGNPLRQIALIECNTYSVPMSGNITLRLDEALLRRIRHLAVDRQTSVSAWVSELVSRAVTELDGFEASRQRALSAMRHPVSVRDASMLSREQAHER